MFERDQGEVLRLEFEVTGADVTLTGTETVSCALRRSGALAASAAPVPMTATFVPASGLMPDAWVFEVSTAGLTPGVYDYGAWVEIGAEPVSLGGGKVRINKNPAALP